ncbi:MAG: hypothetical protein SPH30_05850 [Prevotella sp.]|nr:hypothetical protein [Prevotella sp.]
MHRWWNTHYCEKRGFFQPIEPKRGAHDCAPGEQKISQRNCRKNLGGKDRHFFAGLQKIRWKILRGGTYTQGELATMTGLHMTDISRIIGILRKEEGLLIHEAEPYTNRRVYWMEPREQIKSVSQIISEIYAAR